MDRVLWCGFDYGQTLMDPTHIRVKVLLGCVFIDREVEEPGIIDRKVERYYELKEKYGDFPRLKEKGRQEIYSDVLNDDPELISLYDATELKLLKPSDGLMPALELLRRKGISLNVVSDVSSGKGLEIILRFLGLYRLREYFTEIYTGLGRIRRDGSVDESYKGLSKRDGSLYDKLVMELSEMGIPPSRAVIIGDHPVSDIQRPRERGFVTIGYVGVTRTGTPGADYEINHFRQLGTVLGIS